MYIKLLTFEEGYRRKPYYCSEGFPTIGIGKKIGCKGIPLTAYTFECSLPMAQTWLEEECHVLTRQLFKELWFANLDYARQAIIVSMAYQMGLDGLYRFRNMIAALEEGKFKQAGIEALDSRWAKQTPERATRHAQVLANGKIEDTYKDLWDK